MHSVVLMFMPVGTRELSSRSEKYSRTQSSTGATLSHWWTVPSVARTRGCHEYGIPHETCTGPRRQQ